MRSTKAGAGTQSDKFKQTARELGCDPSEEAFDAKLRTIAKQKPKEPEPKRSTAKR